MKKALKKREIKKFDKNLKKLRKMTANIFNIVIHHFVDTFEIEYDDHFECLKEISDFCESFVESFEESRCGLYKRIKELTKEMRKQIK